MGQILLRVSITGRETEAEGSLFRRGDVMEPQCSTESPSRLIRSSWALLCPFILGPWASSPGRASPLELAQTWHGACPGPASLGGGGVPPPCECDLQVDVRVSFTFTPGWWPSRPREWQPRAEAHSVVARQWPRPCSPSSGICPEPGHTVGSWLSPFVCS